jgi:hypothetical protein
VQAERIAHEIEGMQTSNPHQAEERNQSVGMEENLDEEDRYSSVLPKEKSSGKPGLPPSAGSWRSGPPAFAEREREAPAGSQGVYYS